MTLSADLREVWKRLAQPWVPPIDVRIQRFAADCNRQGVTFFDYESAIRNNILPNIFGDTHLEYSISAMQGCKL